MAFATDGPLSTLRAPGAEQVLSINGMDLYYKEYGQGPPLLMLHGFFGSHEVWDPCAAQFAQHYRCIVPDLRGHGRSTNPGGAWSHRQSARDMFVLLDQLGIGQFRAIGMSTGAMTLLHMAIGQPERVEALVLMSATYIYTEQSRAMQRGMTMDTLDPGFLALLRKWHPRGDDQVRSLVSQFHGFKDCYDDMNLTPAELATISARTLIVHGDRDEAFPVSIALEMYHAISRSFLWVVPNATHAQLLEAFGAVAPTADLLPDVALPFLRGHWASH